MKRIISVFLAVIICITCFAVPASAASTIKVSRSYKNGYTYVTLSCSGYTLYYTTDGSKPDTTDNKYTKKLKITEPTTLRVAAYKNDTRKNSVKAEIAVRVKAPTAELLGYDDGYYLYSVSVPSGAVAYATVDGTTPSKTNGTKLTDDGTIGVYGGNELKLIAYKSGWKKSKVRTITVEAAKDEESGDDFAAEVLRLVNIEREKNGLSALKLDETLGKAAQVRADELVVCYDHTRPDGSSCFTVLSDFNISLSAAGENIAAGFDTPESVVEGWMNSPGHRANILGNYKYLGVGIAYGGDYGTYWAQLFVA